MLRMWMLMEPSGALGHGITDVDVERLVSMKSATAYQAEILSIIRGEKGSPVVQIYYTPANEIGEITKIPFFVFFVISPISLAGV